MALVAYADGVEKRNFSGESMIVTWTSPATMDSADTVVLPTLTGKDLALISCWDVTGSDAATHTLSTATVTIDAAGATTDHKYSLTYQYV